ncbi:uncharacterized protein F4807DRAFT_454388 [Annulohypoxylon truncatum]|uniref:uncharacterized protein n=1 Tax=Annulohypoxylon truncatum TaxID=327061 RepID=UPI00200782AD|nr:uncharacterized protein F4807DRAFT_454388 [Annulohypoxylon truncatum]KAI1204789.1 hypothetical protein F4807DRAFT_454388 [Annulohypoxylon truncatum]
MSLISPPTTRSLSLQSGFDEALSAFKNKLTPSELAQFKVTTLDDLKVTILAIQAKQRAQKQMVHMDRIRSFLEAMEQFGKVVEIFLNVTNLLAFIWGPMKLLLLTTTTWLESFDALLDAYQLISDSIPLLGGYQVIFKDNIQMQTVLRCIWSDILDFHIRALRIFGQSPIRTFFRSLWKDFNSRFQHILGDLKRQKALVESHANHIHIQNYESDRIKTQEEYNQARAHRASEKKIFVTQWIAASTFILDHESLFSVREEQFHATNRRTARWILEHNEVKAWIAPQVPKSSILWLSGIAGLGDVLTSVIVDEIKEKHLGPAAYFYCKYRDPNKSNFVSILRGLLSQLVNQQDHLMPYYYDEAIMSGETTLHSAKLCKKLLRSMLQNIPQAFLVIDGIDECDLNERKLTLDYLREMLDFCDSSKPGKVRLLISSRDESDIRRALSMGTRVKVDHRDTLQDLEVYIEHRASIVQQKFELDAADRIYIQKNVLDRADGMFLYAKLVMTNLEGQPSLHCLHEEFNRLPTGLDEAYERNLHRIEINPNRNQTEIAHKILSWMVCVRRPLRWREIQAAISIDLADLAVDHARRLPRDSDVSEICGSLVEVLSGDRVEFVHVTASLYIMDLGYTPLLKANHSMAILCLCYLTFECFGERKDDELYQFVKKGSFAFQDYAAAHWTDHFLALFSESEPVQRELPDNGKEIGSAATVFADRFRDGLPTPSEDNESITMTIWRHAETLKHLMDDRRDEISLSSLGKSLRQNRHILETVKISGANKDAENASLVAFYGENWFKCQKVSCYYFHEGFQSQTLRQQHYDRHDRPFRCEEEDCPAARIGFGSLKEMEKHKRNVHPGIDKLSSTFARLKGARNEQGVLLKYPCPRCPLRFATRLECRCHMTSHNPRIRSKGVPMVG